ncbi:mannosyltransferase [Saccharibacillus sp. O23]|uniref:glycosyltransferase family 39 protein n=1 Tax=Saccharibacillus sp. O23 TaxID=2009338 RepID=UPI000B4E2C10|nr:glycosyltransferase family 39 protein [Saccharibacillus sp. O23]OWR26505.1 mannosyltransferase [Saccharibacillus sp. O23]
MNARLLRKIDPVPALLALVALTLTLMNISKSGNLNGYYTAAVTSMSQSLHNFFFNSFDPGGFISIDKPPVAFWLQTISVKLFGLHAWSLALPSALALAGSVILLYLIVRSSFGLAAARFAALFLTLTPIAVAVSRTNNVDSVLVFFLVLAAYVLNRAVRSGKIGTLCLAFALVGVGFNTKMMQAYLVLPAFYLFVLIARRLSWRQTFKQLAAATAVLIAVSLSWAVAVDSRPADHRPYVGSTQHNSVLELALGYNGIGRLTGNLSGSLSAILEQSKIERQEATIGPVGSVLMPGLDNGQAEETGLSNLGLGQPAEPQGFRTAAVSSGMMNSSTEDGPPGWLRLFDVKLAGQISWLLPFALFGAILLWVRRPERRADILLWVGWLLPMIVVFSLAGYFHRYYLITLAPGIAALAGAALAELCRSPKPGWLLPGWAIAFGTAAYIAYDDGYTAIAIAALAGGALALPLLRLRGAAGPKAALALGLAALMAAPAWWSLTPGLYGGSARQPYASPHLADGGGSWSHDAPALNGALVDYMERNRGTAKYLAVMPSSNSGAAALIIQTREPVLTWGGFKGVDPALGIDGLQRKIEDGEVRYVLLEGNHSARDPITLWAKANGRLVPESEWNASSPIAKKTFDENSKTPERVTDTVIKVAGALGVVPEYSLYDMKKEE